MSTWHPPEGLRAAPHLRLLQAPAQQPPQPSAADAGDRSRPAPHTEALRAAWWSGHETGYRAAWVGAWRWGVACGFCATLCGGALCAALAHGLRWL